MIEHVFLQKLRERVRSNKDGVASQRNTWIESNRYYYAFLLRCLRFLIPPESSVLHLGCSTGHVLKHLDVSRAVGIDDSEEQVRIASGNKPGNLEFRAESMESFKSDETFDYILVSSSEEIVDIKAVLDRARHCTGRHSRVVLITYNYLWQPFVRLAEMFRMKVPLKLHNWLSPYDIDNMLRLSGYDSVHSQNIILFPFYIPLVSEFLNRFIGRLPLVRALGMLRVTIAAPRAKKTGESSVSLVIPCRNEAGNIQDAVERIPEMGSHTEIVFCDDKSTDGTADKVREMMSRFPDRDIKLVDGPGICKADNVWTGFDHATGDILMILDADLTVIPEELPYFYEAITEGYGEFINGSRLVYPMHDDAMRFANVIGNKFFSSLFSYILDTRIKDTLCGTKVMWRSDYQNIKKLRGYWGIKDRWGDYELIFGAAKNNLKIIDLPVHYMERTYGETKMKGRFKQGVIMLKMSLASLWKLKFH